MKILFEAPFNSLSFGNVSYNILRELRKKNIEVGIFPVGEVDIKAFEPKPEFVKFLQEGINRRFDFLREDIPALRVWHINGAENRKNPNQYLYTFYECNQPTYFEKSIVESQKRTIFSSSYAKNLFEKEGSQKSSYAPLGFDPDLVTSSERYVDHVVHFGLMGKFEKRKNTAKILKAWAKKYGNDNKYLLTCCVGNPFFKPEQMEACISQALEGKRYTNINFLPRLSLNSEVNEFLNAIDVDLTGLSGGEGWNLPAFNATALGKWSIVLNETSHKDWANENNAILVESSGEFDSDDKAFFQKGAPFNQGTFFDWNEDVVISKMEIAESKARNINQEGRKLATEFSYERTVDSILNQIEK
jgi:hypothetical protein